VEAGKSEIVILPYFLFPGRISQAIVDRVGELSQNFPQAKLVLTPPLGATPELARLIAKEIKYLNSINYTF
jgi:sirohydrochlorin ferrochelatase